MAAQIVVEGNLGHGSGDLALRLVGHGAVRDGVSLEDRERLQRHRSALVTHRGADQFVLHPGIAGVDARGELLDGFEQHMRHIGIGRDELRGAVLNADIQDGGHRHATRPQQA